MRLATRLGNLGNILDEDESQLDILRLDSPVLLNGEYKAVRRLMGDSACEIDSTFRHAEGESALRDALYRIQAPAVDAVAGGCTHVVPPDQAVDAENAGIPMIPAPHPPHTPPPP